ncbi:MAG: barstar family protein [Desulforhopalus sp.]|nr:barstar family protein [Desulforhopalus sp.]
MTMQPFITQLRQQEPGVYHLPSRPDISGGAADAGSLRYFALPPLPHVSKEGLLEALRLGLDFPEYFGGNWDAAFDCLTDRSWHKGTTVVIELPIAANATVEADTLAVFAEVLRDACTFWIDQGVQLYCLLPGLAASQAAPAAIPALWPV